MCEESRASPTDLKDGSGELRPRNCAQYQRAGGQPTNLKSSVKRPLCKTQTFEILTPDTQRRAYPIHHRAASQKERPSRISEHSWLDDAFFSRLPDRHLASQLEEGDRAKLALWICVCAYLAYTASPAQSDHPRTGKVEPVPLSEYMLLGGVKL